MRNTLVGDIANRTFWPGFVCVYCAQWDDMVYDATRARETHKELLRDIPHHIYDITEYYGRNDYTTPRYPLYEHSSTPCWFRLVDIISNVEVVKRRNQGVPIVHYSSLMEDIEINKQLKPKLKYY